MSEHMKQPRTRANPLMYTVIIEIPGKASKRAFVPAQYFDKLETFLEKFGSEKEESVPWEKLSADRIARYSKAGIALRGARYREGISQKELARRTGISQENISKMENGARPVGPTVAQKLANALHINKKLLLSE